MKIYVTNDDSGQRAFMIFAMIICVLLGTLFIHVFCGSFIFLLFWCGIIYSFCCIRTFQILLPKTYDGSSKFLANGFCIISLLLGIEILQINLHDNLIIFIFSMGIVYAFCCIRLFQIILNWFSNQCDNN